MSGWVTFALVVVAITHPSDRCSRVGWASWALVVLGLVAALLVDAKGWP